MPYVSHYIKGTAFAEWLKTGRKDAYKGANVAFTDLAKLGLELGQYAEFEGHIYRAVRVQSAITSAGYIVKSYMNNAARTGTASAGTKATITTADTLAKGDVEGGRIILSANTGATQTPRRILSTDGATSASKLAITRRVPELNLPATFASDAWATAPDATTTYNVHCDWEVEMTTAVGDSVAGVGLGAVTSGNITIICVEGPYVEVFCVGSTDALTTNGMIVPSATTGVAKGPTAAGLTATEAAVHFGRSYEAFSGAAAARLCRLTRCQAIGGQRLLYTN